MLARADFFPATSSSVMANITLQFNRKDLQFKQTDNVSKAAVNILRAHHDDVTARGQHV